MIDFQTPLCELAYRYGSDKCPQIKHPFTLFYHELFAAQRMTICKVLEIGIGDQDEMRWSHVPDYQTGASLKMWRDFFPNATIYGADIKPGCLFSEDRIRTYLCDQRDLASLTALIDRTGGDLDIVIDDGTHIPQDQVSTCRTLMPLLQPGVTYIIEDVGHNGYRRVLDELQDYDCRPIRHSKMVFRDDRIVVVRHRGPA